MKRSEVMKHPQIIDKTNFHYDHIKQQMFRFKKK